MTPYSGVIKLNLIASRFDIVYKNKKKYYFKSRIVQWLDW